MTDEYDDTAEAVFDRALSISDREARRSYMRNACGDDDELRENVESLLAAHDQAASFLEDGPDATIVTDSSPVQEAPGSTIGRYKLLEQIGEGGFGVVYMAEQQEPFRRKVALKIIKLGMDTKQVIGRFEAERQALALMDHANIAKVFDAGATGTGRPYFVMELVKGVPITEFCDSATLNTRERLELFAQVCDAVQHAHQKGIIHRDIKPSNVLVALHDDRPVPKVIDFGIAKATVHRLTERTVFTEMRQLIGTPAYMSPEQATFNNLDIDTRSDVYSLGALLYELLTGTAPFDDKQLRILAYDELCRVIREEVPPTPSQRVSTLAQASQSLVSRGPPTRETERSAQWLRGEVDWIVMKALEKDRQRRYESASHLSADVQRYLRGEPVLAVRPSMVYRLRKFSARHRALAASVTVVSLALIIGGAAATVGFIRAEIAGTRLQAQLIENRKLLYQSDMTTAMQAWHDGRIEAVEGLLRRHTKQPIGEDLRGFEWYYLWQQLQHINSLPALPHEKPPFEFVFFDGERRIVSADGLDLKVWDVQSGSATTYSGHTERILAIDRAMDRKLVVSGGVDGTIRLWDLDEGTHVVLERLDSQEEEGTLAVTDLELTPDGSLLAAVFDTVNTIYFWNPITREALEPLVISGFLRPNFIRLSHDGHYLLATLGEEYRPVLWDLRTRISLSLADLGDGVYAMTISPQNILAVGTVEGIISLWDLNERAAMGQLTGHAMPVTGLAFSPDGSQLASGGKDNVVRIWDVSSRHCLGAFRGTANGATCIRFSPSGEQVASLGHSGTIKIWDVKQFGRESPPSQQMAVSGVAFLDGGNVIVSLGMDGSMHFSDPRSRELLFELSLSSNEVEGENEEFYPATVSADGKVLAVGTSQGNLILFDLCERKIVKRFRAHVAEIWWPAIAPDGRTCATASRDGSVRLWNVPSGRRLKEFIRINNPFEGAAYSSDGTLIAAANFDTSIYVWNATTGQAIVSHPRSYHGRLYRVVFSPDGRTLAACGDDSRIVVWDLSEGVLAGLERDPRYLSGHAGRVLDLAFSADSKLLASGGIGSVLLWDVASGQLRATFQDHERQVTCVAFSPDGTTLLSGDDSGKVVLRQAATPAEVRASGW